MYRKKEVLNKNTVQLFKKWVFNKMFYPEHDCRIQCLVQREMTHEKVFIYRKGRQEGPQFTTFVKMQCFGVC